MDYEKDNTTEKTRAGTIYDDVYRTLTISCSRLLLPVLNEVFGEHYTGEEYIDFSPNEHFLNRQDGEDEKRITDTSFTVHGTERKRYLFECQSRPDSSMLVRMFEYSTQIALDEGKVEGDILKVDIPHCAILYLRSSRFTPDKLQIQISTPGGAVTFDVYAIKLQEYTIEEIFDRKLFMLIPFYIFTYEKHFGEYDTNEEKLSELQAEYAKTLKHLDELVEQEKLSSYEYNMIIDMSKQVLEGIAARYEKVRKGVREVFGGRILETEWDRRYRAWSDEKARSMRDKGMDDDVIEYILKSFERELKSYKTPSGKIMYEGGKVSEGSLFETEWVRRYRAGESDTKKRTAFILRDMGLKEADIAHALEVSISKVEEWFEPVST